MQLDFFLIADYANITIDGKLNVMGVFNSIHSTQFPTVHPEMYLVAKLSASPSEYGSKRKLSVKLLDEDAQLINSLLEREIEVPHGKEGRIAEIRQILRLTGLSFPKPGTYEFSILVDNDQKGIQTIRVVQISKAQRN